VILCTLFPQGDNLTEFCRNNEVSRTEEPSTGLLSSYIKSDALEVEKTGK